MALFGPINRARVFLKPALWVPRYAVLNNEATVQPNQLGRRWCTPAPHTHLTLPTAYCVDYSEPVRTLRIPAFGPEA